MATDVRLVSVPATHIEGLETALGFYPYGDESLVDISSQGEFIVPQDVRTYLMELAMQGALEDTDITHARALKRLETHTAGEIVDTSLYEYQKDVVHGIKDFLQFPDYDENDQPIRSGYVKLPTATGKTAIFAHTVQEVSNHVSGEQQRLKTLVLVPGRDLVTQTVGEAEHTGTGESEEILRGFAKFAPEMSVSEYHGGKKDLSGDVVVMTYASLNVAMREGRFDADMFDVVVGDEIHRALGSVTRRNFEAVSRDKIAIGFSATTEYGRNRKVEDMLPTEIFRMELRDAVEKGYLAPVRAIALTTNEKIISAGVGDFKEEEMQKLITSEWRNKTSVSVAAEFVSQGQNGIITCVPGEDLRHAREIAQRLNEQVIIDSQTGELRNVRALTVAGTMSVAERREIYKKYENGEIDVLTTVDLLNEGWDSTKAKFLINLRPTTSPVLGTQRLGRILRPSADGELATVVEFIDDIEKPGEGIFTFYHAIGEKEVTLDKVYGRASRPGIPGDPSPYPELPPEVKQLAERINHKVLDERIFGNKPPAAPEDFMPNRGLADILQVAPMTISKIAQKLDIKGTLMLATNGNAFRYYSPEEQEAVTQYIEENWSERAGEKYVSKKAFMEMHDVGGSLFEGVAKELGIEGREIKFQYGNGTGYTIEEQERIADYIQNILPTQAEEGYLTRNIFAERLVVGKKTLDAAMEALGIEGEMMHIKNRRAIYLSPEQQEEIEAYLKEIIPPIAPEGWSRISDLVSLTGRNEKTIKRVIEGLGIEGAKMRFDSSNPATGYSPEDTESLVEKLKSKFFALEDESLSSATLIGREEGFATRRVQAAAKELGIEGVVARFGAQTAPGYSPEERKQITEHLEGKRVQDVEEGYISLVGLKRQIGDIGERTLKKIASELGITGTMMAFQQKPGLAFSEEEQQRIIDHVEQTRPPRPPEGYLSAKGLETEHSIAAVTIKKAADELGITGTPFRFRAVTTTGFSPDEQQAIINHIKQQ